MSTIECVNFTLKTRDINTSVTYGDYTANKITTAGEIKNSRTDYIWYNVNIRNIIGSEMYNKYNKFNLCLNNYAMTGRGTVADTDDNNLLYLKLSGFPWCSSYDFSTKNNNVYQTIRCLKIPDTASATDCQIFNDKVYFTFSKFSDNISINIKLLKVSTDAIPAYANNPPSDQYLGHMSFNFSIYPVIENKIV